MKSCVAAQQQTKPEPPISREEQSEPIVGCYILWMIQSHVLQQVSQSCSVPSDWETKQTLVGQTGTSSCLNCNMQCQVVRLLSHNTECWQYLPYICCVSIPFNIFSQHTLDSLIYQFQGKKDI